MNSDSSKLLCPCGVTKLEAYECKMGARHTRVWKFRELKGFTVFMMRKCM
jgi:hypothetical protein